MGTDTLAAPDERLYLRVAEDGVELRRCQLLGTHRGHVAVEECLGLGHEGAKLLDLTFGHVLDGAVDNLLVEFAQSLMLALLHLVGGEGVAAVQVAQDAHRVLLGTEVSKDPVERLLHVEGLYLDLVAVEGHEVGLHAEGAGLVQTSAARRCAQLAHVGDVHLAQRVEVQII